MLDHSILPLAVDSDVLLSYPGYLVVLDDKLYFAAMDPDTLEQLFVYDPAMGEASIAANAGTGAQRLNPYYMTVLNGKMYMSGWSSSTGAELYVYDPVLNEANLAADIVSGPDGSYPMSIEAAYSNQHFTVMEDMLFFTADNGNDGWELYHIVHGESPVYAGDMNPGLDEFIWTD